MPFETVARLIKYGSSQYEDELRLRDDVLRKPLGLSLFAENLDAEKRDTHIGAFIEGSLVGVLVLAPCREGCFKMRQVAVSAPLRRHGIGRQLVAYAEAYACDTGHREIVLNARRTAEAFYRHLGYSAVGSEFTEVGIPHIKMRKELE